MDLDKYDILKSVPNEMSRSMDENRNRKENMNPIRKNIISILAVGLCSCCTSIQSVAQEPEISIADAKRAVECHTFNGNGSVCCELDGK